MSDLMFDVGQANELKMALRRAGATPEEVKRMGEGNFMSGVVGLLRGTHDVVSRAEAARLRARNLYEHHGVWYVTLTSNGWTGERWIGWFTEQGIAVPRDVHDFLVSPAFKPTKDVVTKIAIVPGKYYPGDASYDICSEMEQDIKRLGLAAVNAEVACLLCQMFLAAEFEKLGFSDWYVMHEPMRSEVDGGPARLIVTTQSTHKNYGPWLRTVRGALAGWDNEVAYVYACRS